MAAPREYNGGITREQFLFFETKQVAKLKSEGYTNEEILKISFDENILQMKTEKSIKILTQACIRRLDNCGQELCEVIANSSPDIAKQANLYAMMLQNRIVWDFMLNIIAEKYKSNNFSFSKKDINLFLSELASQNEQINTWSESTLTKIRSVLIKILAETDYLDNIKSETLNPVFLYEEVERVIVNKGDEIVLPAFNRFIWGKRLWKILEQDLTV